MIELQYWSDHNVNISLYFNTAYDPKGPEKKFFIRDMRDSTNNCDFNNIEFAVKYVEAIIKMKKGDK